MNWGKGIIIGMGAFMLFILMLCFKIFSLPADEYDHHYYEKGLNFDKDYDREKQVSLDHAAPDIRLDGSDIHLHFREEAHGTARLVRPSSVAPDKSFVLNTDEKGQAALPLLHVPKGRWKIVLEWKSRDKKYLYEKEIDL